MRRSCDFFGLPRDLIRIDAVTVITVALTIMATTWSVWLVGHRFVFENHATAHPVYRSSLYTLLLLVMVASVVGLAGVDAPESHSVTLMIAIVCGILTKLWISPLDLRHTCASHLLQGTWAPKLIRGPLRLEEVKAWLDHSDIGVTQRYAHLAPDAIRGKVVTATLDDQRLRWGLMNFEIGPQTGAIFGI